jgi:hypothetical protein
LILDGDGHKTVLPLPSDLSNVPNLLKIVLVSGNENAKRAEAMAFDEFAFGRCRACSYREGSRALA